MYTFNGVEYGRHPDKQVSVEKQKEMDWELLRLTADMVSEDKDRNFFSYGDGSSRRGGAAAVGKIISCMPLKCHIRNMPQTRKFYDQYELWYYNRAADMLHTTAL